MFTTNEQMANLERVVITTAEFQEERGNQYDVFAIMAELQNPGWCLWSVSDALECLFHKHRIEAA